MEYTIKRVSEMTGLSAHVLRYYEKEGLLPRVGRGGNGFRRYSQEDLELLGLICCLKNTGMSLRQIKEFVDLSAEGPGTLRRRCEMLIRHKADVENRIAQMRSHLEKVTCKIAHFTDQCAAFERGSAAP